MSDNTNEPGRSAETSDLFDLADLYDALPEAAEEEEPFDAETSLAKLHIWIASEPELDKIEKYRRAMAKFVQDATSDVEFQQLVLGRLRGKVVASATPARGDDSDAGHGTQPGGAAHQDEGSLAWIELEKLQVTLRHDEEVESMNNQQQLALKTLESERRLAELDFERVRLEVDYRNRLQRTRWGAPAALVGLTVFGAQLGASHHVLAALLGPSIVVGIYMLMLVVSTATAVFSSSRRAEQAARTLRLLLWHQESAPLDARPLRDRHRP